MRHNNKSKGIREILLMGVFWRILIIEGILLLFSLYFRWLTDDADIMALFWYAVRIIILVGIIIAFMMITLKIFLDRHIITPLEAIAAANREVQEDFRQTGRIHLPENAPEELRSIVATRTAMLNRIMDISEKRLNLVKLVKKTFGRYLSEKVVESILTSANGRQIGGRRQIVTVLMSDLKGFTGLFGTRDPEEIVQMLNRYLEEMSRIILRYDGIIDEIIGDAILAVFGAPESRPDDAQRAVICAIEMQNCLLELNQQFAAPGYSALEMGIGINSGDVIVGNIGSKLRMKYGIVGDTVNRASRIEVNSVGGQVLIGEATFRMVEAIVSVDPPKTVMMKGMKTPLVFFAVKAVTTPSVRLVLHTLPPTGPRINIQLPVQCRVIQNKVVDPLPISGTTLSMDERSLDILLSHPLQPLTDVRLNFEFCEQAHCFEDIYAKCTDLEPDQGQYKCSLRITAMAENDRALIRKWANEASTVS